MTYEVELENLKQGKHVPKIGTIIRLDSTLHEGLIVVGGRLRQSNVQFPAKHPVIVPSKHQVAHMIVLDTHNHARLGVEWTLSRVRRKYWVIDARNIIKRVENACVTCKRLDAHPEQQKWSKDVYPTHVAFNIFSNYYVKFGRSQAKRYWIFFTCFNTRAAHILVIESLKTDAFIYALVKFVARRGSPAKVFCDNASTLLGDRNEL